MRNIKKLLAILIVMVVAGAIMVACNEVLVTGVALNKTEVALTVGGTEQLTATVAPSSATNKAVTWTSSDDDVATVTTEGLVAAVGKGEATITVTTSNGDKTATATVVVTQAVMEVSLNKSVIVLNVSSTEKLEVQVEPSDANLKTVTWTSSDDEVATVAADGTVTAVGTGKAVITVTTDDGAKVATAEIVVADKIINDADELMEAILEQDDNEVWAIMSGNYDIDPNIEFQVPYAPGRTGWYFPIYKDSVNIIGINKPVIYSTTIAENGIHQTQNFITIWGNSVTIDGLELQGKISPNKTIEVIDGKDFNLIDTIISPNTFVDFIEHEEFEWSKEFGGSVYFSSSNERGNQGDFGEVKFHNVTLNYGFISFHPDYIRDGENKINGKGNFNIVDSNIKLLGDMLSNGFGVITSSATVGATNTDITLEISGLKVYVESNIDSLDNQVISRLPESGYTIYMDGELYQA